MKELTFYRCNHCGNFICMINDSGAVPVCCGEEMERVTPNTQDASAEKHVPVIQRNEDRVLVSVGSLPHPMEKNHYIEWIILQTSHGTCARRLIPESTPEACFHIRSDEYPVRAYIMCNLHGLWSKSLGG